MCEIFIEMLHISLYNLALIRGLYPTNEGLYASIKNLTSQFEDLLIGIFEYDVLLRRKKKKTNSPSSKEHITFLL